MGKAEVKMASAPIAFAGMAEEGSWENERACGPISWIMCVLFSPFAVLCCGPFDVRKVYTTSDGTKYDDCGKLIDETTTDCLCPTIPLKGAYCSACGTLEDWCA